MSYSPTKSAALFCLQTEGHWRSALVYHDEPDSFQKQLMEHIWSGILDFEKEYPFKAKNVTQTSFKHCAPHVPPASNTSSHTKNVLVAVDRKHPMTAGCTDLMMVVLKKGEEEKWKEQI